MTLPRPLWTALGAAIPVGAFGASALLFTWIGGTGRHLVGIAVALFLLCICIGLMRGIINGLRIEEAEVDASVPFVGFWATTTVSLAAVLILLCVFAELSLALFSWQLALFLPAEHAPTYPDMLATYMWFLIDLVPFTDPAHTFGMKEPRLRPQGWIAGAPILAFQGVIVVYLLEVLRRSWILYQRQSTRQFLQRLGITKEQKDHPNESSS